MFKRLRKIFLLVTLLLVGIFFDKKINYTSPISVFSNNSLEEEEKILYKDEWVKEGESYFYYGKDGKIIKNDWINDSNQWYHVDNNGKMQKTEWINDGNNDWFYVGQDGSMQKSKWIDGKYYVNEKGKMLKNTPYMIGNKAYIFDSNGVGIEIPPETTEAKSYSNSSSYGNSSGYSNSNNNSGSNDTVYVSGKGKRYHSYPGCSNMKNPSAITKTQALSRGYTACSKCW